MESQKKIQGYVPEATLFQSKQGQECRIFHNDCAIINAKDHFRILAERGFGGTVGLSFLKALSLEADAVKELEAFPLSNRPALLLPTKDASLFLFSGWYSATGLLLAVRISKEYETIKKHLKNAARPSILEGISNSDSHGCATEDPAEPLEELLFYTERIFSEGDTDTPMMQTHLLANFAGCRLNQLDLPATSPFPDKTIRDRYSAFLLCLFLTLRKTGGAVSAKEHSENVGKVQDSIREDSPADLAFSITQEEVSSEKTDFDFSAAPTSPRFLFPFMELSCFQSFKLEQSDGALRFEMTASRREYTLFTATMDTPAFFFHFTLRPLSPSV